VHVMLPKGDYASLSEDIHSIDDYWSDTYFDVDYASLSEVCSWEVIIPVIHHHNTGREMMGRQQVEDKYGLPPSSLCDFQVSWYGANRADALV
jgi:hypothetical protein